MPARPRLLFVDHAFHRQTRSFDFLRALFAEDYDLTVRWVRPRLGQARIGARELNAYDYVVFCQLLPPLRVVRRARARCVWVPMYDCIPRDSWFWRRLALTGVSVLCFSRALESCLLPANRSLYVRYFPPPAPGTDLRGEPEVVFLWDRGDVSPLAVAELFDAAHVRRLILLRRADAAGPPRSLPDAFRRAYGVEEQAAGFRERQWYLDLIRPAGVFVAPRWREGIGHTFLEAMAMGKCVIGHTDATMNEYIEDGRNGLLADLRHPRRLNPAAVAAVLGRGREAEQRDHQAWLQTRAQVAAFVRETPPNQAGDAGTDRRLAASQFRADLPLWWREVRRRLGR